jgi:uncharacterized protein DUF3631
MDHQTDCRRERQYRYWSTIPVVSIFARWQETIKAKLDNRKEYLYSSAPDDDFHLPSIEIVNALNEDKDAPWAGWHKGEGLTVHKLSALLKPFGLKSKQEQANKNRARGYIYGAMRNVFEHYLQPEKWEQSNGTK